LGTWNSNADNICDRIEQLFALEHSCTKYRLGKLTDSEDLLQRVIFCREQNGDGDNPELWNNLGCLAAAKYELGKFGEGEDLQKRAVEMAERLYGYESAEYNASLQQLSIIQAERGQLWWTDDSESE
jgi:hypothetical protein